MAVHDTLVQLAAIRTLYLARALLALLVSLAVGGCDGDTEVNGTYFGEPAHYSCYKRSNGEWVLHGELTTFYPSGAVKAKLPFVHGELQGLCTEWYEGGGKKSETTFFGNQKHGMSRGWTQNGRLLYEGEYRHGKPWAGRLDPSGDGDIQVFEAGKRIPGDSPDASH